MLVFSGASADVKEYDVEQLLRPYASTGVVIRLLSDTVALGVFRSPALGVTQILMTISQLGQFACMGHVWQPAPPSFWLVFRSNPLCTSQLSKRLQAFTILNSRLSCTMMRQKCMQSLRREVFLWAFICSGHRRACELRLCYLYY